MMIQLFALLALLAQDDKSPFDVPRGTYVFRIGDQKLGEEEVEFTATGWKAKGKCEIPRQIKVEYEAQLDGGKWSIRWKDEKQEIRMEAELRDGTVTWRRLPEGKPQTLDVSKHPNLFFYADLIWAHFREAGRALVASQKDGVTSIYWGSSVLSYKLREFSRSAQTWKGKPVSLWFFALEYKGIEIQLLCAPNGLPLRLHVPAQGVEVALTEFEALEMPGAKPTSIVDSGEWRKSLSPAKHEFVSEKKTMIPMRDGVKLAADVYRPAGEGKFPAILSRTPYGRNWAGAIQGTYFARRGYVFVAQDVRGRGESEGEWFPLRNEERDGSDTIDWLAKQPWCDGNVGMIGASYVGWVQWYAAKSRNPHLKAIVPQVAPPDPDQNIPYEGGVFLLSTAWWGRQLEAMGQERKVDWIAKLKTLPLGDIDTALDIKHPFLDEWLAHPPDDPYWDPLRYQRHYAEIDVPALNISGWYDGDQPGAPQNFEGMRRLGRKGQYLIMGPWSHAFNSSRSLGETNFGPEAVIDLNSVILRFFDRYLKGADNGIDREDPVHVFVMGENKWHREKEWPLPAAAPTKLFLASDGCAHRRCCSGRLGLAAQDKSSEDEFRYDPMDVPETPLVDFNDLSGANATADCSVLKDRDDILDYTSPPLAAPVEITGSVTAVLSVSTSAEDTDFAVTWYRLTPEGKMFAMSGGIQRLRYRTGKDAPVKPGEIVSVEVDCWATGVRLEKGDRIRVEVSSWGWPGYARNLNTLEPQAKAAKAVVATNRVYHDAARASYLLLPVVAREGAGGLRFE